MPYPVLDEMRQETIALTTSQDVHIVLKNPLFEKRGEKKTLRMLRRVHNRNRHA